ncbi:unnamed protein product [Cuscuta campestris]|uniref:Uncharacterized protein n=1 Tax=Cuscuta campestris TaxID=132261 RepID=A0A484MWG5_9ASTE|nr:unnamed protein product [Cuscuta campestris]
MSLESLQDASSSFCPSHCTRYWTTALPPCLIIRLSKIAAGFKISATSLPCNHPGICGCFGSAPLKALSWDTW